MLVSKSFLITGGTTHRAGPDGKVGPQKDIAEKVDAAINSFLKDLDGTLVDLKPNVQIGSMTDTAFITVIVEVADKKETPKEDSKKKK